MLDPRHERLLDRILTSRHFSHTESLKRILCYICENSNDGQENRIREYDLAVQALGRSASFDPKTDPIVRVSVDGIRQRLRSYFEAEGLNEPLRLEIPTGQFRAIYTNAGDIPSSAISSNGSASQFWRPYLNPEAANVLVYSEVLFFRDNHGNFVRNIYINDVATGQEDIRSSLPGIDFEEFTPCYHFASAGEMHCVLFLARQFQELGVGLQVRTSRFTAWNELRQANLIFVGSTRISTFIESLQGEQPFVLTPTNIKNRYAIPGEPSEYSGRRYMSGKTPHLTEYALVTRQAGLSPDTSITVICSNHGRAIEAAGFYLSREDALERMLGRMGMEEDASLPPRFQVLFEVEMVDSIEDVVSVEYLTHRVF